VKQLHQKHGKWSKSRQFGNIGENVACAFLEKHGFEIVERNYLRKWGEVDIVAKKGEGLHFVEVKSISHVTSIRAEENMHPQKLKRLQRVVQTYILEKGLECDWQIDLAVVTINSEERTARVSLLDNIL
jgi:putative endonuclease